MSAVPDELQVGQAPTMSRPQNWPLVAQPSNRSESFLKDARLVNCYAEKFEEGYQVEKRFGIGPVEFANTNGAGQGMYNFLQAANKSSVIMLSEVTSTVATVWQADTIQTIHLQAPITATQRYLNIGEVQMASRAGGPSQAYFLTVDAPEPYLVFGSGYGALTYYIGGGGAGIQTITDPNFPADTVPGFALLDGTTYVMDTGSNIWGSAGLNNPTTWDALNVIQANSEGDLPIMLVKQLVYVIALKSSSVQIFFDAGNATGSPLSPVPGALIKYGCIDASTVQSIDGNLLWVTSDENFVCQVGIMESLQFKIISTPAIDRFLNLTTQISPYVQSFNFLSFSFKFAGHRLYGITNVTANVTMVYDIDQGLWYQWTDPNGNYFPVNSVCADLQNNLIAQSSANSAANYFAPDYVYPNDDGALFPVDIYTPNFTANVAREKTLSTMHFDSDQTAGSRLLVRYSDDDYGRFNNFRQVDLNRADPILCDEGSFYRRAYHFRHLCNTPLRIRKVGLEYDVGTL